jgi:hypothetical protein
MSDDYFLTRAERDLMQDRDGNPKGIVALDITGVTP